MEEVVDIVDKDLNIIQQISKADAHNYGMLHKCVVAEIIDSQGNWTLVKQAAHKQDAGKFVSPVGGHVAAGESDVEALKREAQEEVGVKDFEYSYRGKAIFDRVTREKRENHYFIQYEVFTDEPLTINEESVEYRRFSPRELIDEVNAHPEHFGEAFIFCIKNFYPKIAQQITWLTMSQSLPE